MRNPNINYAKSEGIDLPILYCYLAGRISGDKINNCLAWRKKLVNHYKNYSSEGNKVKSYPIAFLCPLNSGESSSVDTQGLTSSIPPNLIYDKDLLSIQKADVIVANMDDFFEIGIEDYLDYEPVKAAYTVDDRPPFDYEKAYYTLLDKIRTRRENLGTICEVAWALYLQKPVILIVPKHRKRIFETHPFMRKASVIVYSEDQLIKEKWLQTLYKSIAGAVYDN